jgi:WD40 repeat protein
MRPLPAGLVALTLLALSAWAGDAIGDSLPPGVVTRLGSGTDAVRALAVAPDGTAVAVARGATVGLFQLTGTPLRNLAGHRLPVTHLCFSPTDGLLASAAEPGELGPLRLWDPASGELLRRWGDAGRQVCDLTFSADGQVLAVLEPDALTLHNPRLGRYSGGLPLPAGITDCRRLALSPDGRTLVAGGDKSERVVWDLPTRRLVRSCPAPGPCRGLHFLPDGQRLLWLDADDLRVWMLTTDETRTFAADELPGVTATALSPDGRALAVARGPELGVWDVSARRLVKRLDGHRGAVQAVAFSPDGRWLVSGDDTGTALVWDISK